MSNSSISFNFHPTQDLDVRVSSLNRFTASQNDTYYVELNEEGQHVTIFFSDGEALTKFSDNLQQKILDARMAEEGVPA